MESAIGNVADFRPVRKVFKMFWDPEPVNDIAQDEPVWCLGHSYQLADDADLVTTREVSGTETVSHNGAPASTGSTANTLPTEPSDSDSIQEEVRTRISNAPETPPESTSGSFSSSLYERVEVESTWPRRFLNDFESRFWMTYRSDFEHIPKSTDPRAASALSISMRIRSHLGDGIGFSSDTGWGCMIRSGQSLLANAISMLLFGRDWRRGQRVQEEKNLIALFADHPNACYSIHSFVRHGADACGKYPGEWFGPSATARCIQDLTNSHEQALRVYSTGDGPDVYEDSFLQVAQPEGTDFHPTLILVGTRLGIDKVTPVYWQALIASLQMTQSVGIAGGRPSSSHYFVGAQGDSLFYLDPHETRTALPYRSDTSTYTEEEVNSCHTKRLRRMHVREMDPSMLIGFLILSKDDWVDWRRSVKHVQGKAVIHVSDKKPGYTSAISGREGAIDEVETLSDDDDDTVLDA